MALDMYGQELLAERERLKDLKSRYLSYVDRQQWDLLVALYTDDTVFDIRTQEIEKQGDQPAQGKREVINFIKSAIGAGVCHHLVFAPVFEFRSDSLARVEWGMKYINGRIESGVFKGLEGYGHSHDVYVKEHGVWLIKSVKLVRLFETLS